MQYIIQNNKNHWNHIPKTPLAWKKASKKGHFAHIGNEIKICSQNKCHHHLSNVCENSFRMFHSNWVISDRHSFVWQFEFPWLNLTNCPNKWPSYCCFVVLAVIVQLGDGSLFLRLPVWSWCSLKTGLFPCSLKVSYHCLCRLVLLLYSLKTGCPAPTHPHPYHYSNFSLQFKDRFSLDIVSVVLFDHSAV